MRTTKKSPVSNSIGIVLIVFAAIPFLAQYFTDLKQPVENWVLAIIAGVGLIVWLGFSDQFFKLAISYLKTFFKIK